MIYVNFLSSLSLQMAVHMLHLMSSTALLVMGMSPKLTKITLCCILLIMVACQIRKY